MTRMGGGQNGKMDVPEAMLDLPGLERLLDDLMSAGYAVVGPTVRDGVIAYDTLAGVESLPKGWHDEQRPGYYRLHHRIDDHRLFDHTVGPHSWKRFTHPATESQVRITRTPDGRLHFESLATNPPPTALIGVRPCELAALSVQDRVLADAEHADGSYPRRRAAMFVVAERGGPVSARTWAPAHAPRPGSIWR